MNSKLTQSFSIRPALLISRKAYNAIIPWLIEFPWIEISSSVYFGCKHIWVMLSIHQIRVCIGAGILVC